MAPAIIMIIIYFCLFMVGVLITRLIFSIPTIVSNMQMQTKLLEKIAERQGVTADEIEAIRIKYK